MSDSQFDVSGHVPADVEFFALMEMHAIARLFMSLGFRRDQVEISPSISDPDGDASWGVILNAQGRSFCVHAVKTRLFAMEHSEFRDMFSEFMDYMEDDEELVCLTYSWQARGALISAMIDAGFVIPGDALT